MNMKKIIAAATVSLLLAGALWITAGSSSELDVGATAPAVAAVGTSGDVDSLVPIEESSQRANIPVTAATPAARKQAADGEEEVGTGSLLVRVLSSDTELPVEGVAVSFEGPRPFTWFDWQMGTTDERGEVLFSGLRPAMAAVVAWRTGPSGETGPRGSVDVREGAVSYTHLTLPTIYSV